MRLICVGCARKANVDADVPALRPSQQFEFLPESVEAPLHLWIVPGRADQHADAPHALALLRARHKRPRCRSTTDQRDELAPPDHSITSSARASSVAGTSRPRALAVLRLITSSYLVGCWKGRSPAFSPRRIRSTYDAAPRYCSRRSVPYETRPPVVTNTRSEQIAGKRCRAIVAMVCSIKPMTVRSDGTSTPPLGCAVAAATARSMSSTLRMCAMVGLTPSGPAADSSARTKSGPAGLSGL